MVNSSSELPLPIIQEPEEHPIVVQSTDFYEDHMPRSNTPSIDSDNSSSYSDLSSDESDKDTGMVSGKKGKNSSQGKKTTKAHKPAPKKATVNKIQKKEIQNIAKAAKQLYKATRPVKQK